VAHAPAFGGAPSFLRRRYSRDLAGIDVAVLGIPMDTATSHRPGARFGPRGIRAISSNLAWARPWPWTIDPFEALAIVDYGDCQFDFGDPASMPQVITEQVDAILAAGAATLVLGGDHYVTYPVLRAYHRRHGPLSLVHFDAHSDTWPDEGERVDHGTMFYHAVKHGLVDDRRSAQIGLRTTNDEPLGFNIFDARAVHAQGPAAIARQVLDIVGDHPVYLTFDIDCLDPSVAPGTGTPVCGGLSSHQALEIVRGLAGINLVGMDVVEVAPVYDVGEITALAGATLAAEFLCLFAANPRREAGR
jgi:agmatinase